MGSTVSAQLVGVEGGGGIIPGLNLGLKTVDEERYGTLMHPGDSFSYDMFSQAAQAVLSPGAIDVLGGLSPELVIAAGESQSAMRMVTYVNAFAPWAEVYDGYLIHSRPGGGTPLSQEPLPAIPAPDVVRIANAIQYTRTISSVPKTWIYKPEDYVGPDLFAVEHLATEQKVVIGSSIPAANVGIWTTPYQVSPEQFIVITLEPSQVSEFTRTYVFAVDGFVAEDATGDGTVDVNDLSLVSSAWLSEPASESWQPSCDVSTTKDDAIDLHDFSALARQWRQPAGRPAPVAHWRLDETSGSAAADERGRHDGTLHDFATDGTQWIEGMDGGALLFDGVDDYVEIADYAGVTGTRPRTVTAWVKLSERPYSEQVIAAWGEPTAGNYWLLAVATGGKLRFDCQDGYAISAAAGVNDTKWHHVAVVLDPTIARSPRVSDVKLYIDGQRQAVFEITERDIDTKATEHLRLGAGHSPTQNRHFNGIIDDVRLFDSALSAANIRRIYAVPLLN